MYIAHKHFVRLFSFLFCALIIALSLVPPHEIASAPLYDDEFNGPALNQRWSWLNEDATRWSLAAHPGHLQIVGADGDMWMSCTSAKNILLQQAPTTDFEIQTKLTFLPTAGYQQAGLLLFQDVDNYIKFDALFNPEQNGQSIEFIREQQGAPSTPWPWHAVNLQNGIFLKLSISGGLARGLYSLDGVQWSELGSLSTAFTPHPKMGLYTFNAHPQPPSCTSPGAPVPADFDYFRVTTPTAPPVSKKVAILVHGWQGTELNITKFRCLDQPIPYTAGSTEFGSIAQDLVDKGYIVYFARWTTSAYRTILAEDAAKCLAKQISAVRDQDSDKKVTLIAHSMGGLVSRAYIESNDYQDDVDQLVTLGTPHVGVNLAFLLKLVARLRPDWKVASAVLCTVNPGTCQLATEQALWFNLVHQPSGSIPYDFVGGSGAPWWWAIGWAEGPNDGIVGQSSANGVLLNRVPIVYGDKIGHWQTNDVHFDRFADWFGKPEYFTSEASRRCLKEFLAPPIVACNPYVGQEHVVVQQTSNPQYTATISGTLTNGESRTFPIQLEGTAGQTLLGWNRGDVDLTLTAPDGTLVTPANASQVLQGGGYAKEPGGAFFPMAAYYMQNPAQGNWLATITATQVVTDTDFVLFGAVLSPITLAVDLPSSVAQGEQFTLHAHIDNAGTSVPGASVTAFLISTTGMTNIPLHETTAGVYSGEMIAPADAGQYQLSVQASGTMPIPFTRQEDHLLDVRPSDLQRNGVPSVQAIDANGNGKYESLRVNVPIAVNRAGSYVANAILRDSNGVEITRTRGEKTWETGSRMLSFEFNGYYISMARKDGPYSVDLEVVSTDPIQLTLDEKPLIQTDAYTASQFESVLQVHLPVMIH